MTISVSEFNGVFAHIKKLRAVTVERGASKTEALYAAERVCALEQKYKRQLSARRRREALEEADQAAIKVFRNSNLRGLRQAMRDVKKCIDEYNQPRFFQERLRRLIEEATKLTAR